MAHDLHNPPASSHAPMSGPRFMRYLPYILLVLLLSAVVGWLFAPLRQANNVTASPATQPATPAIRIGLIPERDIFHQRQIHQAMAQYIGQKLGRPAELVTASQYRGILIDLAEKRVDVAFMGSLVTTLAADRLGAKIVASPELDLKVTTYRGVLFVPESSPIKTPEDLAGHSIAMARETTGGSLYAVYELARRHLLSGPKAAKMLWVGSHDDAIHEVIDGRADAGCVKDLRLDDFEMNHPAQKMRRLCSGEAVPENAVVVRADLANMAPQLREILLNMHKDPDGRAALKSYGAICFRPCSLSEYKAIYDMIDSMGDDWPQVGMGGPPPARPASVPPATTRGAN